MFNFTTLWTVARQTPQSMGFSRQEYWSGSPCPPPGNLPNPGIELVSLMSPALAGGLFTTRATWEAEKQRCSLYDYLRRDSVGKCDCLPGWRPLHPLVDQTVTPSFVVLHLEQLREFTAAQRHPVPKHVVNDASWSTGWLSAHIAQLRLCTLSVRKAPKLSHTSYMRICSQTFHTYIPKFCQNI